MLSEKMQGRKRLCLVAILVLLVGFCLSGCGKHVEGQQEDAYEKEESAEAVPAERQEPLLLRCSLSVPFEHPEAQVLFQMAALAEERTGGMLRMEISTDGALAETGDAALRKVMDGDLEMALVSSASLQTIVPEFAVFGVPFQIRSAEHLHRVLTSDAPALKTLYAETEESGICILGAFSPFPTGLFTREDAGNDPAGLDGCVLSVRDSASSAALTAAGAVIREMPESEVYPALLTGLLDGAEGDLFAWVHDAFYTAAPFFNECSFHCLPDMLIINAGTREKLTAQEEQMLLQLTEEAAEACFKETEALREALVLQAEESGAKITAVNADAFRSLFADDWKAAGERSPLSGALAEAIETAE